MLDIIIASIVSYLGVFVGKCLSDIAKEEVKDGSYNLFYLQATISALIAGWMFYNIFPEKEIIVIIDAIVGLAALFFIFLIPKYNYAFLGMIFALYPGFITSSLIFLYGFPAGSLMYKDSYIKILKKTWLYFAFAAAGFLIRSVLI